jgi:hypothetical protein
MPEPRLDAPLQKANSSHSPRMVQRKPQEETMPKAKLIFQSHARGEYEIGIQTEDGAVVARVSIWGGTGLDQRSESEREEVALEKATRLAHAFSAAVAA